MCAPPDILPHRRLAGKGTDRQSGTGISNTVALTKGHFRVPLHNYITPGLSNGGGGHQRGHPGTCRKARLLAFSVSKFLVITRKICRWSIDIRKRIANIPPSVFDTVNSTSFKRRTHGDGSDPDARP